MSKTKKLESLVCELPKSKLPASFALDDGIYPFFLSGPKPKSCDEFIFDGKAVVLSTGGNAAVHIGKGKFAYSTDCWALAPDEDQVNPDFLFHWLTSKRDDIDVLGFEGSGLKHLRKDFVRKLAFEAPTVPEQSKIAEILSTIDQAIELTESLIAKQQRIKTGLMQDLLTRGIDECGNLRSEETHEFKDSTLGRIPVEWEVKNLDAVVNIIDCKHYTPAYVEDGIPLIRPRNIKDRGFDLSDLDHVTEKEYVLLTDKHKPTDGDIVFSRNASFGVPVYVEGMGRFCIGQDVVIMSKKEVDTRFVFYSLKSDKVISQIMNVSGGSTFSRIDLGAIRELKIQFPINEYEQNEIAIRLLKCDEAIENSLFGLSKLNSLKTALMQDLLTGKKSVTPLLNDLEDATV